MLSYLFCCVIGTLHVCSCQQVLFHSEWNAVVSLWGTWEADKPSLKKFINRPGLRQLIQVLEPSSTCTHRPRYQLHSGLPYLAAADNLAVALTQVLVFLQFLQSSISQQQSWLELQGLPVVAAPFFSSGNGLHAVLSLLVPTCIFIT